MASVPATEFGIIQLINSYLLKHGKIRPCGHHVDDPNYVEAACATGGCSVDANVTGGSGAGYTPIPELPSTYQGPPGVTSYRGATQSPMHSGYSPGSSGTSAAWKVEGDTWM